jgi:SAM-dependent methyltransferase
MRRSEQVVEDFDRIARLLSERPEEPDPYDGFVLSRIPPACRRLLEVGCGAGRLARALAARGIEVTGIDASPEMIALARRRSAGAARLHFVCGDLMTHPLEPGSFDAVLAVATLHHLPAQQALERIEPLLRPGGVLVIHDLRSFSGLGDRLWSGIGAMLRGEAWGWVRGHLHAGHALREAWHDHGSRERYGTMEEIARTYAALLPGAVIHRHPLCRYTAVWTRA